MDQGNYGTGFHSGVPVYFNQSSVPHKSMYQSYPPNVSQPPVYFHSHSFPVRAESLYQPAPVQPGRFPPHHGTAHISGPSQAVTLYPHIQTLPQPAQVQPQAYTSPPPQQFTVPTQPSNLLYKTSPPPALLPFTSAPPPPAGVKKEGMNSLISFSSANSANSALSSALYRFSGKSEIPVGTSTVTTVPPYLNDQQSASSQTPSTFLQAAFQHGIKVENPKRKTSDISTPAAPLKEDSLPLRGFDKMKRGCSDVIERQHLVDYYVNKHENLGQKLKEKNMRDQNKNLEDKIFGNMNNNAEPFVNEDKNSSVLHWLSKTEGLEITSDSTDYMKIKFEQTVDMTADKHLELSIRENIDEVSCIEEGLSLKQEEKMPTAYWYEEEDKNDSFFDDSIDIIEDHEFLSGNLKTATLEYDSTFSSFEESAGNDEGDGEINTSTDKVDHVNDKVVRGFAENCDASQKISSINVYQQSVEIITGSMPGVSDKKEALEFTVSQTLEENTIQKYQQQLQEAENSQIEILTTTGTFLEQIASKIVKKAVARGVLIFFSSVKGTYADFKRDFTGTTSDIIPVENSEEIEKAAYCPGETKKEYRMPGGSATACYETNEILQEGQSTDVKQENGHVDKTREYADGSKTTEKNNAKRNTQQMDDFEKFFFKQTASRHGITITSPEKEFSSQALSKKDVDVENTKDTYTADIQNQNTVSKHVDLLSDKSFEKVTQFNKSYCKGGGKKVTEDIDLEIASIEGSHSDSGEAFRMKASQRGILVQDSANKVEISTDSDAELEQIPSRGKGRRKKSEQAHGRNTSTPDTFALILNPDSLEFKPRKKQTVASRLRADAAEFNPGSLSSSFSLNSSVSESEASEKLDSSMRVDAPEFMPGKFETCSNMKLDAASFETNIAQLCQQKVLSISKLKDKKPNKSVAIQTSPNLTTVGVGTKKIKTKETCSLTGSCETRDVAINTEHNSDVDCKYITVKKQTAKQESKASNTDRPQQRSVAINVRLKHPVRPASSSVMTMTEALPLKMEKCLNCDAHETDLVERLKKQDILLASMGKLQIELMLFKEKEIREKISGMKENLKKKMTGVMGLFTDSVEASVLQSMIESKLTLLEDALAQVESVTSTTISQIQSGTVLDQLPDFGSILQGISKSPVTTNKREAVAIMADMGPKQGTNTKPSSEVESVSRPAKIQRSVLKECTSPEHVPCRSMSVKNVSEDTSANISQVCSRASEVPHHKQSSLKHYIQKRKSLPKKRTEKEIQLPELNTGTLSLSVPENFNFQCNENMSELESPKQVNSGQKTSENKCIGENLSVEMSPVEKISEINSECEKEEVAGTDTVAESAKESSDLKTDGVVLANYSPESKGKTTRMKGFMEIEDSSDEEEGEHECGVIDKVDDPSKEANDEAAGKQKMKETPDVKYEIAVIAENQIKEKIEPEKTTKLESKESMVKVNVIVEKGERSDLKILSSDKTEHAEEKEDNHDNSEMEKKYLENSNISDNCGIVVEKAGDTHKQITESDIDGAPKASAICRLISEKMSAEYGNESIQSLSNLNAVHHHEVNNGSNNENSKTYDNSLDAIDSDDNEMMKSNDLIDNTTKSERKENYMNEEPEAKLGEKDAGTQYGDVQRPTEALKGTTDFNEGYSDKDSGNDTTVASATKPPPGLCGSEINIDSKEVFISPPKKSELGILLSQHSQNIQKPTKSSMAELPANPVTVVSNSVAGNSNMPVMLGNMDPVLFQAVLAQLIQAYPELASNQEMLTQVAIQQTGLLQMYIGNQSGSGIQMFRQGIGSGELRDVTVNPNMLEFGQDILKFDQIPKQSNKTLENKGATINDSSKDAPGTNVSHLNTASQSDIPTCKQMQVDTKPYISPALNPLTDSSACEAKDKSKPYPYSKEDKASVKFNTAVENDTEKLHGSYNTTTNTNEECDLYRKKEADMAKKTEKVKEKDNVSSFDEKIKLREISLGLDEDFDPTTSNGARPKTLNKSSNTLSEELKASTEKSTRTQTDFLPDFAKRHKQENTSPRVVHHFVTKVSDTVSRAIANSDQVHFEKKTPSPVQTVKQVECKAEEPNFPPLQKSGQSWPDVGWGKITNKNTSAQKPTDSGNSERMPTKTQKPYVPPRLCKQASASGQPYVQNQDMKQYRVTQEENWEDEVENYAPTFTLHHDVNKPISMATQKNKSVDFKKEFHVQVSKQAPDVKSSASMAGLCDIPLPISAEKRGIDNEAVEEWQEVQSKRKRHSSKDQKKELRQFTAPFLNSAPVTGGKQVKKNNFDRLVGIMQQEFQQAKKEEIILAIGKIREERGTLSGLSMEAIIEKAHSFIKPAKKKIPGLWADKKQQQQTLNITSSLKPQPSTKPVSVLNMKLPPRKPASVGLLKLDIPPRRQHLHAKTTSCTNTFKEDICVICHDPLTDEPIKELDCMHVFHSQCISQWVERERTCPTCRKHALFPEEFPRLGK